MPVLKVQLNHPGNQKPFIIGNGYQQINNYIIREWNNDPTHYRKFIRNNGHYLTSLDNQPKNGKLLFWGEWEGNSIFTPLNNGKGSPNGIHIPFHSTLIRGFENTDPYIYGDYFKYSTCSQSGELLNMAPDSIVLFGTTKDIGFELDTVFVVKTFESALSVFSNKAKNYSPVYQEETLELLEETYLSPNPSTRKKLYHSQTWWDNKEYFSFVPCKPDMNDGFKKALLPIPPMARQKVGHPFQHLNDVDHFSLWRFIVNEVIKQGFCLGVKFFEPVRNDNILNGFIHKQASIIPSCGGDNHQFALKKSCK
jgi:hypothetical protein